MSNSSKLCFGSHTSRLPAAGKASQLTSTYKPPELATYAFEIMSIHRNGNTKKMCAEDLFLKFAMIPLKILQLLNTLF
jgi:hypothetical protein